MGTCLADCYVGSSSRGVKKGAQAHTETQVQLQITWTSQAAIQWCLGVFTTASMTLTREHSDAFFAGHHSQRSPTFTPHAILPESSCSNTSVSMRFLTKARNKDQAQLD